MRFLDAAAITAALSPAEAVEAITVALTVGFDPAADTPRSAAPTSSGHFLLMPTEVGSFAGVKVATVAPDNPAIGLPRIQAAYLLFDALTLSLRAVLDGTALTTLRTPAVSIAAIRPALARIADPLRVAVYGTGPQAIAHADTLAAIAPIAETTFIVRNPDRVSAAVTQRGSVIHTDAAAPALANAHLIICATSARTPLFPANAVGPDAIVIAVGSHEPDARELDADLMASAAVIVEDPATALREAGDIILAHGVLDPAALIPMKNAIDGTTPIGAGRVVFKSVGMSWEDLVIASAVADPS